MKTTSADGVTTVVDQAQFIIPDLTVKDLLSSIPSHCFKRSAFRSSLYMFWDFFLIACIYKTATYFDTLINPATFSLPSPFLYTFARFALWSLYGFAVGLVATGLWVVAHECGHQAFSESKFINNAVGWVLHSGLGVPYHSWRISHAKHHASTGHMSQDQVFVPKTRSQLRLPAFDSAKEDVWGSSISNEVMNELREALGESPIGAMYYSTAYLLFGWPLYLITNASGQKRYPAGTNHFNPNSVIFSPNHYGQIIASDIGVMIWLGTLIAWIYKSGFAEVFRLYLVPYLWHVFSRVLCALEADLFSCPIRVNHWLILITFLQHTDPLLPHYRAPEFTFPRGALATLDRNLLGDLGSFMGWIGACTTHGISETHVAHHVASKIPHYHAWEATYALRKRLGQSGIKLQGAPGGWKEVYRVMRECRFVEDEGDVLFYKNSKGLAATRPVFPDRIFERSIRYTRWEEDEYGAIDIFSMSSSTSDIPLFPFITRKDVLAFQFSSWYPSFSALTIKSTVIRPLSSDFRAYLDADSVFVPNGSEDVQFGETHSDRPAQSTLQDDDDSTVPEEDGDEDKDKDGVHPQQFAFPELDALIRSADASWLLPSSSPLKCTSPADVYLLLKSSDFITHDLSPDMVFAGCDDLSLTSEVVAEDAVDKYELELVLRKWYAMDRSREMRCFVREGLFVGISQRDMNYYDFMNESDTQAKIVSSVKTYWETHVKPKWTKTENYVFDILLTRDLERFHILDFNPYAPRTDALLFTYEELRDLAASVPTPLPRLRIIDSRAHPAAVHNAPAHQHNMVPFEALSLSSGRDIGDFREVWEEQIKRGMEESDESD
ncbi:hypothetical protein EW146_g822 [Bondarzewia mesenterica]|uniref:Fatty acid desaturase domain-containing protein n=1 Tax=Bondarzewia mesenterica TaxID=1095465 RepID=A0A4V3XG94_9AGAM|nr:hypothetical protein EW146_g822 [Bondarzewia mesenterica]